MSKFKLWEQLQVIQNRSDVMETRFIVVGFERGKDRRIIQWPDISTTFSSVRRDVLTKPQIRSRRGGTQKKQHLIGNPMSALRTSASASNSFTFVILFSFKRSTTTEGFNLRNETVPQFTPMADSSVNRGIQHKPNIIIDVKIAIPNLLQGSVIILPLKIFNLFLWLGINKTNTHSSHHITQILWHMQTVSFLLLPSTDVQFKTVQYHFDLFMVIQFGNIYFL